VRVEPDSPASGEPLAAGEYIELCVVDNGEGMAPEVLARIFDPFFSTRFAGRGLGLPAALGLVRAHKGTMAVESKPGAGTTFRIHIPLASGRDLSPPRPAAEAVQKDQRVALIAEDEEAVRRVIVKYMGKLGWKTIEAADGEDAIRSHRDNAGQIDLLLCDYLMPKVNGLEAAQEIRNRNPKVPVILMSGFTNEDTVESFRAKGFEHFLKKPFGIQELRELLMAASAPAG